MNVTLYVDLLLGVLLQTFGAHKNPAENMYSITATWDHAVNSKAKLQSALASESTMIEADVITGHLIDEPVGEGEKVDRIPIMGHPPAITSDLSLQEFLDAWNRSSKILKLDFKSTSAFMSAIPIMEKSFKNLPPHRLPWLNADILPGPGPGDSPGVDADVFLGSSSKKFPDSILSLGWTTKRTDNIDEIYSEKYIDDMVDVLFKNKYMKPVTYAVRASIAANSLPELQYLLETSPAGSTLTAWCSDPEDVIDNPRLVRLINAVGANRIYLDLPEHESKALLELYAVSGADTGAGAGGSGLGASVLSLMSSLAMKNVFF